MCAPLHFAPYEPCSGVLCQGSHKGGKDAADGGVVVGGYLGKGGDEVEEGEREGVMRGGRERG
jgi:hypothetical protein